jgi:hypothetical protein
VDLRRTAACKQGRRPGTIGGCEAVGVGTGQLCRHVVNIGCFRKDGGEKEEVVMGEDGDAAQECVDDEVD